MTDFNKKRVQTESYERTVIVPIIPGERNNNLIKKQLLKLNPGLAGVNTKIAESINTLWDLTSNRVPQVVIRSRSHISKNESLKHILANLNAEIEHCRICVELSKLPDEADLGFLINHGLSHLVCIRVFDSGTGWYQDLNVGSVTVKTSLACVENLIHDIALDIAMFYSTLISLKLDEMTLQDCIDFSNKKVEFAVANKLKSFYGPIVDTRIRYFCLAACCRDGHSFHPKRYIDLWNQFIAKYFQPDISEVSKFATDSDIADYIISKHRYGGTVSRNRLIKKLREMGDDMNKSYLFLMTIKKPSRKKYRKIVAGLFGRLNWRSYYWKIIPYEDRNSYYTWAQYILFFKFRR